ncbi:MAG: (Fe-S)-binding protein [Candidatus Thorarchaeota archaeon]
MTEIDLDDLMENLAQCRRCGICRNAVYEDRGFDGVCPVWKNSTGFETSFMRGRIQVALALLDGTLKKTAENAESLYTCTLCGNCTEICAAEFDPAESLEQVRAILNEVPNDVRDSIAEKIMAYGNPYDNDNSTKRDWVADVGFEIPTTGETLYYTGCTAGMKLPMITVATAKILKAANIEFGVLEDEPCCGSVMLRTGRREDARINAEKLADAISKSGAKRLVVSCAGCLKTLRKDLPEMFGTEMPEIVHILELVEVLIGEGKLKPKALDERITVTYHDPCHMGRALGIYESPRAVLNALPGVELVELETNRNAAMCCGAGGGLRSYDSKLAKDIGEDRVMTAELKGADIIASACPFCEHNLKDGVEQAKSKLEVVDIVELVAKSLE